jgi:hypothetical protein
MIFFVGIVFNPFFFPSHVSYIEFLLKIYWDEIIIKKCNWILMENSNYSPYVHFKSPLLYDWCKFIKFHLSINISIQVGNFNP